ncbi:hypothetical protein G7Y89_g2911 [Cudoniella acicularis]|uniref:Uncharacterized protein n=1 Tax=Cudoniella acicularis TaxID=354080 RepID=A0A8H4RUC3_9HELO|nr:hypothetical protein G7Y89_g2911 [Cudoniella acicularis]
MTDQMGTPGSTADTSVNGSKTGAPKDKACPFCHQQFTSSSLGRHLDLYIKEKNPKPPDGVHDVDEIRKMRGGITRRQPRSSTSRREDSTPAGTPSAQDRRSPRPESARENRSPSVRRDDGGTDRPIVNGRPNYILNKGTWESTGVMNVIPPLRNGDARCWDGEDRDGGRKTETRSRSVSKQMLAKTTFEQKQKMIEALDNAKAAELALRELLGSIRAAKQRIEGPSIFDYDPLTLDFPALCLHCLPPPPTLYQSIPLPTSTSWSILPPDDQQYQALHSHFSTEFHRWRVSCAIANTATQDDLSYPPPSQLFDGLDDPSEIARRAEASASELESRISEHLHSAFAQWNSFPPSKRQEIWMLEFARSVGRKSEEIQTLKKDKESSQQEMAHLRQQVDELSRLQHPREFKLVSPTTVTINGELMNEIGEVGIKYKGIGFDLMDRHVHLDTAIERAIGRWKDVVKGARGGGNGLAAQRSLSGEHAPPNSIPALPITSSQPPAPQQNQTANQTPSQNHLNQNQTHSRNPSSNSNTNGNTNGTTPTSQSQSQSQPQPQSHIPPPIQTNGHTHTDMGSDPDADADADMDDDDSFIEMTDAPHNHAPSAPAANFRLANGSAGQTNGNGRGAMEGIESQVVPGYVRIGA